LAGGSVNKPSTISISNFARYTANFSPPTELKPDAQTLLLWNFSEGGMGSNVFDDSGAGHWGLLKGSAGWENVCHNGSGN
jgi:hypothetical protein